LKNLNFRLRPQIAIPGRAVRRTAEIERIQWVGADSIDLNAASSDLQLCFSFGAMLHF
jgi:hypothetical protein